MNDPLENYSVCGLIESPTVVIFAFIAAVPMWFVPSAVYQGRFLTVAGLFLCAAVDVVVLWLMRADGRDERLIRLSFTWLWAAMSAACVVAHSVLLLIENRRLDGPAVIGAWLALPFALVAVTSLMRLWFARGELA